MISYYAIIPANVRYDKDLTPNAKLLYAEITALCNQTGRCWATNQYFAKLYNVSTTSVSKWISQLIAKGYINSEIEYKEGTKEILKRYLSLIKDPIEEKLNTPIEEKLKDNNININTTSNNIESAPEKFCFTTELIKMGLDKTLALEWMKIRKKSKNTEKALELFKNELNKSGLNINDFVSIAVSHGWQMPKSNYEEVRIAKIKQNDIEKRKNDFKAVLSDFVGKVDKDTLNDFYRYYTQANDENIMLFERIAFFNVAYRLLNHKKNK